MAATKAQYARNWPRTCLGASAYARIAVKYAQCFTTKNWRNVVADFDTPELLQAIAKLEKGNYSEAAAALICLANEGNPRAQCNLASLYHLGLGVTQDGNKAVKLYEEVARMNILEEKLSAVARNNLATIFTTGLPGVEPDAEKSRKYQQRAEALGFGIGIEGLQDD